jgi:hypothetical protein
MIGVTRELPLGTAKRIRALLKLNNNQLKHLPGQLTGHCLLKGHLFELELVNHPASKGSITKMKQSHKSFMSVKF